MSINPFFLATNHHSEDCGTPPQFDDRVDQDVTYRSYFENEHGEQWVLIYNAKTDLVTVYSGDCGWENALSVTSLKESLSKLPKEMADRFLESANSLGATQTQVVTGDDGPVILGKAEQMWIAACMEVLQFRRRV